MRQLALSDEILLSVDKPTRYTGGEFNSRMDAQEAFDTFCTTFAMCFPDVYEIGMSNLGIQIIYDLFNRRPGTFCDRVFSPWTDLDPLMRQHHIPLFGLESQRPVKDFDFLGISLGYEMCYTNILQVLDLSDIPFHAEDRTWEHPIVIGGGSCTYNPEPIAPFFDLFYIGEGETQYWPLMDLYEQCREEGLSRREFLKKAGNLPGMYAPQFYTPVYHEDGTLADFVAEEGMPARIRKEIVHDVSDTFYPEAPIVPTMRVTQDRVVLEIMRGCIRGCRFCQAGMIYRPVRERSVEFLKDKAVKMLKNTGNEEITLSSLSSSDYRHLKELIEYLIDTFHGKGGVNISLPSLRIDAFSLDVMSRVQDIKKSSLTFAPEAGTQRLRDVINKGITEEDILEGSGLAFEGGWNRVKLYFMLGLPTETEEDMRGIAELSERIAERYYEIPKEKRAGKVQITASSSFFIPKPFTPFQWARMFPREEYLARARVVNQHMKEMKNKKSLSYQWHDADTTILEGVFARGDRRIAAVIEEAYRRGCFYDAWTETFHFDVWMQCFADCGLDPDFYIMRERPEDELFPWDFIDIGVNKRFLLREWHNAREGRVTPNCRAKCQGCGAACFGEGVCVEGSR